MRPPVTALRLAAALHLLAGLLLLGGSGFAQAETCLEEVGKREAQTYVDQCLEVSPATRPPCNAQNSCEMIVEEIVRGCAMLDGDAPEFCADYEEE